ncbi:putative transcriptional regulator [Actinacidiphila reveromycinica]|uniref:Putative transcriptional regulator n=1 Tax=Actinacidiphila reveromycinica TaxID=659352 RepID=A0A7U3UNM4_9ACTN|nr:BTAD domain-containing putative transcriptional regulator [Streptomyces sp. SN-593]BBA95845.1 putative transcriptional regulator [Streptomyces sp. SN-593]
MAEPLHDSLRLTVLGPLSVGTAEGPFPLGPLKQRLLLAMLLLRANTPVSLDLLTDTLWDGRPPRTARKNIQVYISALRKLLDRAGAGERLAHHAGGYLMRVRDDELDVLRFRHLARGAREATAQGALGPASRMLREALGLWQELPLRELRFSPAVRSEAERLDSRYVQVYEDWAEVELRLGRATEVAETVGDLVERHPERERLRAVQMTALFDQGRQTEALAAYAALRQLLAAEYGLQPSAALETLYRSILDGGPQQPGSSLGPLGAAGPRAAARRPGGVLGTVLPQDLADFTGRERHLRDLTGLLAGERRLTLLTGPVGTGKTALAVHAAHRLAAEFPDGRVLLRMRDEDGRPRTAASLVAELARMADLPEPARTADLPGAAPGAGVRRAGAQEAGTEEAAAAWRTWLEPRRVLLVLDDAADEGSVRPLVPDTGGSAVLVTSRAQLAGLASANRLDLAAFDRSESLELLGRIVGHDRLRSCPASAEQIVAATGMLPLAVRVSGLKLAVRRYLPLGEYAARLADGRTVLDELVAGDTDVRPRLDSGWNDLPTADRTTLCLLAELPEGPFTLRQAAEALTCDQDRALHKLESLMDAGALIAPDCEVTAHAAHYELPRLTQVYAREQALQHVQPLPRATA